MPFVPCSGERNVTVLVFKASWPPVLLLSAVVLSGLFPEHLLAFPLECCIAGHSKRFSNSAVQCLFLDELQQVESSMSWIRYFCFQMKGSGILLLEDDSVYEGNFTEDLTFVGKVSASFISACLYSCLFSRRDNGFIFKLHTLLLFFPQTPRK